MQRSLPAVAVAIALGFAGAARAADPPGATPLPADAPAAPSPAEPAKDAPPPEPPDMLDIEVLTFGPGDHPFFKFGHDAILVRDVAAGQERVYNFGTFRFDSPRLIGEFMKGRLTYWL